MASEKSPAFQFYPKDYLTDMRVRVMTFEQRGLYWEACSICWLEGSLPADVAELAAVLGCPLRKLESLWPRIAKCFEQHGERLTHKRLDKERIAQAESRRRRTDAADKRWEKAKADALHKEVACNADAKQCSPSSSPSPTSSPSSTAVRETRGPSLTGRGESVKFFARHGQHVSGFCDWVCLDQAQVDEFAGKIPGADLQQKREQITLWAKAIRDTWAEQIVPDGSHFDFWRNRWTETHGGSRPANATLKAAKSQRDLDEAFK